MNFEKLFNLAEEHDESFNVHVAVVKKVCRLNKLIKDEEPRVKAKVVRKGYGSHDKDYFVRISVAEQ